MENQNYGHNGVLDLDDLNLQNEIQSPSAGRDMSDLDGGNVLADGSGDDDFDLDDDDPSLDDDDLSIDDEDPVLDDDDLALDDEPSIDDEDDDDLNDIDRSI
jgi:hypothetical protein